MDLQSFINVQTEGKKEELSELFRLYPDKERAVLKEYRKGDYLLHQGDPCESIYVVLKGSLQTVVYHYDVALPSSQDRLAIDFLGEYELFAGVEHFMADVIITSKTMVLILPTKNYLDWLMGDRQLLLNRIKSVMQELLSQTARYRGILYLSGRDRLIQYFCDYYERHVVLGGDTVIVKKTRAELAEESGFSLRTVNRVLLELREQGTVGRDKGKVVIDKTQYETLREELESII